MDTPNTIALASAIGTCIGVLIAVPAVYFARVAAKAGKASAASGEDSASSARVSAEASRRSADEAAALTRIEGERRSEERERWHHELGPGAPSAIVAELREGTATSSLFGSIIVPRGYRILADAQFHSGGSTRIGVPTPLRANQPSEFQIEQWPPGATRPVSKEIRFRFWPPLEGDGVDVWTCPCGRPTGESMDGPGHWEWQVPVVYEDYDPARSIY